MLQLYNVRDELARNFDAALAQIAEIGYSHVELALAQAYGKSPEQFKASLSAAGLTAVSAHVPFQDLRDRPEEALAFHIEIGCKFIVIPYLAEEDRSTSPHYEDVKKTIARLGETARKLGVTLLYHNHDFEFAQYKGKFALDDLYDSIPPEILQTEIDVCWAKVGGVDPAEYIRKYKNRAPVVHLKDFAASGIGKGTSSLIGTAENPQPEAFPFRALGQGIQDFPKIIQAAQEAGTQWLVVEQDLPSPGKSPIECAKESWRFLQNLKI
jgi:sugar phosphate isomerase/epimerase